MKLKLEVVNTIPSQSAVVLKPIDCGLTGLLVYRDLPARARERFKIGYQVEAEVPLPDFYPENPGHHRPEPHHCEDRLYFEDLEDGERFYWAGQEHIKTARVLQGVSADYPLGVGYSNCIQISDGLVSGMGDKVEIEKRRAA